MKHSPDFDLETRKYIAEGVRYIADTFKGHDAKGMCEYDTAQYLRGVLESFSDSVSLGDVVYRPGADRAAYCAPAAVMVFCSAAFFMTRFSSSPAFPVTAVVFGLSALCWFVYGFIFGKPAGSFLLKKGKGGNVYAVRNASSGASKRVIICADTDRAYEYRYSTGLPADALFIFTVVYAAAMLFSVLTFLFYLGAGLPGATGAWAVVTVVQPCLCAVYVPALFFFSRKRTVRGAAHNLTGVMAAIGVMKELSDSAYRYKDTEVACLLTCAKNSGQRGAASFIKQNSKELKKIRTTVIVLESLSKTDEIAVALRDESGLFKISGELFPVISHAANNVGVKIKKAPLKLGVTDAARFIRAGAPAAVIRGVGKKSRRYYPNRFDGVRSVNSECAEKVMRTVIETVNILSEQM